jgi:hypothetical protein
MGEPQSATHVAPREGESFVLVGSELFTFKARGRRSTSCSILENATQAGY